MRRYPRKLPKTINLYIKQSVLDKTKQYQAGALLQVATFNMPPYVIKEFGDIANRLLKKDRREQFIFDLLFKEQLYLLLILSGKFTIKTYISTIKKENNWWIRQQLLSDLVIGEAPSEIIRWLVNTCLVSSYSDESLGAVMQIIVHPSDYAISERNKISAAAQEALKCAGIIQRSKYSNSQINKYLEMITEDSWKFRWKKYLGTEHDNIERVIFAATSYWRTDLTAFVNLWDTIDDRMLSVITKLHPELGGYGLGNVGGIKGSKKLLTNLPHYYNMVMRIHDLRLHSYLSHSQVKNSGEYTGPIPYKERGKIQVLIKKAFRELEGFL